MHGPGDMTLAPLPVRPPRILSGRELPTPAIMEIVQRVANKHFDEGPGEDAELSTECFPICASMGSVAPHTDEFGGESVGHTLYSESSQRHFPLKAGDVYELHPFDRHWTLAPVDGQLIFAAAFIGPDDSRFTNLDRIAHDLRWETLKSMIEWDCEQEKRAKLDAAMERERLRGIASVHE